MVAGMNNTWEPWAVYLLVAIAVLAGLVVLALWMKGRPFQQGDVFRASRFSKGNHLFPTQVLISPTNVVQYTPQWFGRYEHSIHMAQVASVGIDTHIVFSDLYIETTGGAAPIKCEGHYKSHANRMKTLIEQYQTAYYAARTGVPVNAQPAVPAAPAPSVQH